MYSEMKKNIENSEPAIRTAMTYEAVRVRELKMSPGTSGASTRRSIDDEGDQQDHRERHQPITVTGEPQPRLFASTSA